MKKKKVDCKKHGAVEWKHHLMCDQCERVYDKKTAEMIVEKRGNKCYCGATFAPTNKNTYEPFSAVIICPQCYRKKLQENTGGKI